ncbi:hypothetical protein DFH28DRAFT_1124674 [Melampsora americana]|nr:hypothetical protein DFH28DRAFT_1124674 [Melampsora americana]
MSKICTQFIVLFLLEILIWNTRRIRSTPALGRTQYLPKLGEELKSNHLMSVYPTMQRPVLDMKGKSVMQDISFASTSAPSPVAGHISQINRKMSPKPPKIPNGNPRGTRVNVQSDIGEASRTSSEKKLEETSRQWELNFRRSMTSWYHGTPLRKRAYATTRGFRQSQLSKQLEDVVPGIQAREAIKSYSSSLPTDLSPLKPIFEFLLRPEGSTESKLDAIELLSSLVSPTEISMRYRPYKLISPSELSPRYELNVAIEMADKCLQFQNFFLRVSKLYHDDREIYQHATLAHTILTNTLNSFWKRTYPDLTKIADQGTSWSSASRSGPWAIQINGDQEQQSQTWNICDELQRQYPSLDIHPILKKIENGLNLRRYPKILSTDLSSLKPLIEKLSSEEGNVESRIEIAMLIAYLTEDSIELISIIKDPVQIKLLRERLEGFKNLLKPLSIVKDNYLQGYQRITKSTYLHLQEKLDSMLTI